MSAEVAAAIAAAAQQIVDGGHADQFPLDVFQTGSGTSTNMNANEVIANLAIERLGGKLGSKQPVHPNDHVNASQSSNDVIPTAIHVAAYAAIAEELEPALAGLAATLGGKARELDRVREDRPHPPAGRGADPAGAGALGLRAADRERARATAWRHAASCRARARRHRGGHRAQRAARVRRLA